MIEPIQLRHFAYRFRWLLPMLVAALLAAQQGGFWHVLSHASAEHTAKSSAGSPAPNDSTQREQPPTKHSGCPECLAFAALDHAGPAMVCVAPQFDAVHIGITGAPVPTISCAAPSPRSRGPPSLLS